MSLVIFVIAAPHIFKDGSSEPTKTFLNYSRLDGPHVTFQRRVFLLRLGGVLLTFWFPVFSFDESGVDKSVTDFLSVLNDGKKNNPSQPSPAIDCICINATVVCNGSKVDPTRWNTSSFGTMINLTGWSINDWLLATAEGKTKR